MTWQDSINGAYECLGGVVLWLNVRQIFKDRGYAGINPSTTGFFMTWGFWNLYYYPHLGQWSSFAGGLVIVTANVAWVLAARHFGRIKR